MIFQCSDAADDGTWIFFSLSMSAFIPFSVAFYMTLIRFSIAFVQPAIHGVTPHRD
jgi:hypothetical protein